MFILYIGELERSFHCDGCCDLPIDLPVGESTRLEDVVSI